MNSQHTPPVTDELYVCSALGTDLRRDNATVAKPQHRLVCDCTLNTDTHTSVPTASSVTTDVLLFNTGLSKLPKCYLGSLIRLPPLNFQVCMLPNLCRPHSTFWFFTSIHLYKLRAFPTYLQF